MAWSNYRNKTKTNKYSNKKVEIDGITFDSKKEAKRYQELKLLEQAGEITNLQLQKEYLLIPEQREFTNETYKKGKNKGCFKKGKLLERKCTYIADFVYFDREKQETVVEDVKGFKGSKAYDVFVIKRKLMLKVHGVRVKEI